MTDWEILNYIEYLNYKFTQDDIKSGSLLLNRDLTCASLAIDTFSPVVECGSTDILDFELDTPLYYYRAGQLRGVYYVQDIQRIAPVLYKITSQSAIALLDRGQHMGGIYTGEEAGEVIPDICGGVPISIKTILAKQKLYGWLPIATPRSNFSQVLFALGATVRTGLDGALHAAPLWDGISGTVPPSRIYRGATVDYSAKVTQVTVTEHQYFEGSETQNLFEGTTQEGDIIPFDEPMHSLVASGFTILESGANYAKVSAGSGTLTGKAYTHNTRLITRDVLKSKTPYIKTFEDAALVSLVNSSAVADRLAAFYKCREVINSPVVHRGETPGDCLSVFHPFDKTTVRTCLQSADITLSNTLKAQEKSLVGFEPTRQGAGYYDTMELITKNTEWIVPEGVTEVRVVLISGGSGGYSGFKGNPSSNSQNITSNSGTQSNFKYYNQKSSPTLSGEGGAAGEGGNGGRIYQTSIFVKPNEKYQVKIGVGGAGGIHSDVDGESNAGDNGSDTTFGGYTSANGSSDISGFYEPISNTVYGARGESGMPGARGTGLLNSGDSAVTVGPTITIDGISYGPGESPETRHQQNYGSPTATYGVLASIYYDGYGGGAAYKANGKASSSGYLQSGSATSGYVNARGCTGGAGADALPPPPEKIYGKGGTGGNGGGGGGSPGKAEAGRNVYQGNSTATVNCLSGYAGPGGAGSDGGSGAPGCAILYYSKPKPDTSGSVHDKQNRILLDRYGRLIIV